MLHVKPKQGLNGLCNVRVGMGYEDLISELGAPIRSLALSNGSYLNFLMKKDNRIKGTTSDSKHGNTVPNQDDSQAFEVINEDMPANTNFVFETERNQDGIIVKLNSTNQVAHWAYYNRNIQTKSNTVE